MQTVFIWEGIPGGTSEDREGRKPSEHIIAMDHCSPNPLRKPEEHTSDLPHRKMENLGHLSTKSHKLEQQQYVQKDKRHKTIAFVYSAVHASVLNCFSCV